MSQKTNEETQLEVTAYGLELYYNILESAKNNCVLPHLLSLEEKIFSENDNNFTQAIGEVLNNQLRNELIIKK